MQKFIILCNYNLKANKPIQIQKFLWQQWMHEVLRCHFYRHSFIIFLSIWFTWNRTFYSFNMELILHLCVLDSSDFNSFWSAYEMNFFFVFCGRKHCFFYLRYLKLQTFVLKLLKTKCFWWWFWEIWATRDWWRN